jgi:hypothetical protein
MACSIGLSLLGFAVAALPAVLADLLALGISPSLNSLRNLGQSTMLCAVAIRAAGRSFAFHIRQLMGLIEPPDGGLSPLRHQMVCCSRRTCAEREDSEFASTDSLSRMIPKCDERLSEKVLRQC